VPEGLETSPPGFQKPSPFRGFLGKNISVSNALSSSKVKPALRSAHFDLNIGSKGKKSKMRQTCVEVGKTFKRAAGGRPTGGSEKRAARKQSTSGPPSHFDVCVGLPKEPIGRETGPWK
jgi:hypothetical protein